MRARSVVLGILTLSLSIFATTESRAEPPVVEKIVALNKSALGLFGAGDHEKAKEQLMEAVVLGKENGLGMHASMARTYLHLGVVYVDGFKDKEKGQRYFTMAQKVRSDIALTPSLASPSVRAVFDASRGETGGKVEAAKAEPAEAPEPEVAKVEKKETKAEARAREKAEKAAREEEARAAKAAERAEKLAREEEARAAKAADRASRIIDDSKTARFEEKIAALEGDLRKAESEARNREQQLREEKEKVQRELAQVRESEKQQRAENNRLQAEERKLQVQIAERDKKLALKDGEVADARAELKREREARQGVEKQDKEKAKLIADAMDREKKAREANEKLVEKQDKEKAKLLAEAAEREKKAREATEKLEKEKQLAEARDKERKEREAQEKAARVKVAEGPELPANPSQPITCPDEEGVLGMELFMHCLPQAQVKARSMVLYYRTTGNAHFDAVTMALNRKGWWAAAIPGNRVTGKSLQYYVEARNANDNVAARNGKAESPNILPLRSAEAVAKKAPPGDPLLSLLPAKASAKATAKAPAKAARRTPASKRTKAHR
jgi:chemotaxis protein histidine kinase CheA